DLRVCAGFARTFYLTRSQVNFGVRQRSYPWELTVNPAAAMQCPALACGGKLVAERAHGITIDRCDRCSGVWFDAEELDRWLATFYADAAGPVEHRMPRRGYGGHPCPRCHDMMDAAGWTDLVFDRCPLCHGLFVQSRKLTSLESDPPPAHSMSTTLRIKELMVEAGADILAASGIAVLVLRLLA